jgi:ATPase subunit of ABC transporter with duplicated ATPase domains
LTSPGKRALEAAVTASRKTVLLISHDRDVLSRAVTSILTLEGHGSWMHGGSYATYSAAREETAGPARGRGEALVEEERRLFGLMKTFKERARYSSDWAKRADAAETRWKRFADVGPPPAPVADRHMRVRMRAPTPHAGCSP